MALDKRDIDKFKKRLLELRQEMTDLLRGIKEGVKENDQSKGYSQHQADEGTDDFDRTISLEVSREEYRILRQIERALEKIEENTYGICDITGKEIALNRLMAVPYATMTVEAQEQMEKETF